MKKRAGFTLIELMVVVSVVGILAMIAYPGYRNYVSKSHRSDAQAALMKAAASQEKFFSDCGYYAKTLTGTRACGATSANGVLGIPLDSPNGFYTLSASTGLINASTCSALTCGYTLTATPKAGGPQVGNGALRMDAVGTKEWDKNGAGTWVDWNSR